MASSDQKSRDPARREAVLPEEADLNPEKREAPNAANKGVARINTVSITVAIIAMAVIGAVALGSYY